MAFKKTTTSEKIRPLLADDEEARKVADQAQPAPQRESSRGA